MRRPVPAACAVATLLAFAAPASAQAAFTLAEPSAAPASAAAGANSDFTVHIAPQGGQIKDLVLHLPPGLIGDPQATPRCTIAQFEGAGCPEATIVGQSGTSVQLGPIPQTVSGQIYNLAPRGTEPARLGIRITPPIGGPVRLESVVSSRPDGGLDSTLSDLPRQIGGLDVTITALDVTLRGKVGGGRAFMRNPTSCGPAETVIDARSYTGEAAQAKAGFTPTGCDAVPFAPTFSAELGEPGQTKARGRPPVTTVVAQGAGEAGVKSVAVTLPTVLSVPLSQIGRACLDATFAAGQCPASAQVGEATAATPLLTAPLTGPVSFIAGADPLPGLVLQLRGPLALTLRGANTLTPAGQVTTFEGIPDVPLDRFELRFFGRERGLLSLSQNVCVGAPPRFGAVFTAHSGATRSVTVPATLVGCEPLLTARVGASKRRTPALWVRVDAGQTRLRSVRVTLPKSLTPVAARVRRARVTAIGAGKVGLKRKGRTFDLAVPSAEGARTVTLALPAGSVRLRRGAERPTVKVQVVDTAGGATALSQRATARSG